jgi:hypothetical protein
MRRVICNVCGRSVTTRVDGDLRKHLMPGTWHSGVRDNTCEGSHTYNFDPDSDHEWSEREEFEQAFQQHYAKETDMRAVDERLQQAARFRKYADSMEMEALEDLALRERFGDDEDYPHLCTLIFDVRWPSYGEYKFTYVALKIIIPSTQEHRWYVTGSIKGNAVMDFDRLVSEFLVKADTVAYATEWTQL